MLTKKTIGLALAGALALGASGAALATPVNVNGVQWNTSDGLYLTINSINLRETEVKQAGDVLTGYGQIGTIDGNTNFCSGCDLTFKFTYTVQSVNGNQVVFNAGSFQFYTQAAGTFSATNPNSVNTSNPWVTLTGHESKNATFTDDIGQLFATVTGTVTNPQNGSSGFGLVDATSGDAMPYLDFNNVPDGLGTFADLNLNSSFLFSPAFNAGCTSTPSSNANSVCHFPITGTGELTSIPVAAVPEPSELGLLGLGLGALGFMVWRRRKGDAKRA